jgi:hypothetical protein
MRARGLAVLAFLLLAALPSGAVGERLSVRPWCELEPFVRVGTDEYPLPRETAARRVLEEGRLLFSAMVYGYSFVYTPSDAARHVEEVFELTPVAEVPWGSPRLAVGETTVEGKRLYSRLAYTLSPSEAQRRSSWSSSAVPLSTGSGEGTLFKGYTEKATALRAAMREAVRAHLRTRVLNKPREVRGDVVLWEEPSTIVRAGVYKTTAKVKLRIAEIIPYRIF